MSDVNPTHGENNPPESQEYKGKEEDDEEGDVLTPLETNVSSQVQFKKLNPPKAPPVSPGSGGPPNGGSRRVIPRASLKSPPRVPLTLNKTTLAAKIKEGKKAHSLKCPRCGTTDFEDARALGKHALKCKKKQDDGAAQRRTTVAPKFMMGNDRMAKLMQIKHLQSDHDAVVRSKEEKERIEAEMELLIKMEHAREKRDLMMAKKREREERLAAEEKKKEDLRKQEEAKKEEEKEKIELELQERAAALMGDESDSDSGSDDEEAKERRRKLQEVMAETNKLEAPKVETEGMSQVAAAEGQVVPEPEQEVAEEPVQEEDFEEEEFDWLESPYEGYTAAHMAAYYGDSYYMSKVIELGGDLATQDPEGRTAFHICVLYFFEELLEQLLTFFHENVEDQGVLEAHLLTVDNEGKTPLSCAAYVDNFSALALLADAAPGAIQVPDLNGDYPLHHSVFCQSEDCVGMLLQFGADPDGPRNSQGKTPALSSTTPELLQHLIEYGADYYGIDYNGRSLLFYACANGNVDIVRYLIEIDEERHGISWPDSRGDTPLHAASCKGCTECVQLLLDSGAEPTATNNAGLTAPTLAMLSESLECVELYRLREIEFQDVENLPVTGKALEISEGPKWVECMDAESGCTYYWNEETGETTWERPEQATVVTQQLETMAEGDEEGETEQLETMVEGDEEGEPEQLETMVEGDGED